MDTDTVKLSEQDLADLESFGFMVGEYDRYTRQGNGCTHTVAWFGRGWRPRMLSYDLAQSWRAPESLYFPSVQAAIAYAELENWGR